MQQIKRIFLFCLTELSSGRGGCETGYRAIDPRALFGGFTVPFCRAYPRESRVWATVSPVLHVIGAVTFAISSSFLFIMATEGSGEVACDRNEQQTNSQLQNGTAGNNVQQNDQPQQQQQQGSMWKSLLVRMFIFWLISNLFRGRQQSTNTSTTLPSTNLFKTNQKIVSWIKLRESLKTLPITFL